MKNSLSEYEMVKHLRSEIDSRMEECISAASSTKACDGQDIGYLMSSLLLPFSEILVSNGMDKKDFIATVKLAAMMAWASTENEGRDA